VDNLNGTYTATIPFSGANPPAVEIHFIHVSSVIDDSVTPDKLPVPLSGGNVIKTVPPPPPPPPTGFKRWGLSLHAGLSIPHGDFNTFFNPGPNFGFDLEYRITPTFSLEGIYGFHRFNGDTIGPFTLSDVTLHQFSANGKVYGGSAPMRPFFNFGGGAYVFTPGGNTHGGLNFGGGFQFDVAPNVAIDTMYNFHNVFTSGSSTQFSTVQGGVRFRF
jgi:opacity protein-like surface antigen